ncbi:HIT family protein [Syntrophaceticus schinkii]|uniref:HIT family hydrolase, diadenosine tetraphosphate hydrolase n=1 Tax=Syntrophaceticus schinkii TaxID=499207 RepID=A0A0B7MHE5_9FIRM|nr:HIT family protein [Syntrophaceticus schinkii]CEO90059.1 HIT family hydrolase, diadenosine tetraphosphate hydrolase [Syntrophaceticus schinkii]
MIILSHCVFCQIRPEQVIAENELAVALFDNYPVNRGHVLVVPKRHVETYFEATLEEMDAITRLIIEVKDKLDQQFQPDGYNIGVNVGGAAGQTIFHLHVHVIPRYSGDVPDPRGGIRRIKKSLVPYLEEGEG